MSKINHVIMTVAVAATCMGAAYAGGPDNLCPPVAQQAQPNYFYVEGNGSWSTTNFEKNIMNGPGTTNAAFFTNDTNGNSGFGFGGNIGYHFMNHMAIEGGYQSLPEAKFDTLDYTHTTVGPTPQTFGLSATTGNTASSWYAYGAVRLDFAMPRVEKMDMYLKGGAGYRSTSVSGPILAELQADGLSNDGDDSYIAPFFGAGISYDLMKGLYVAAEYNYMFGTSNSKDGYDEPGIASYMGKLGYRFSL